MIHTNWTLPAKITTLALEAQRARQNARKELEHERMIEASKAKLAETTLVPGYVNVYA